MPSWGGGSLSSLDSCLPKERYRLWLGIKLVMVCVRTDAVVCSATPSPLHNILCTAYQLNIVVSKSLIAQYNSTEDTTIEDNSADGAHDFNLLLKKYLSVVTFLIKIEISSRKLNHAKN